MKSNDSTNLCIENSYWYAESFVGFLQLFLNKTVMTLKSRALITYHVHAVHLNLSGGRRQYLIDNGHKLVGFPPVCCIQDQLEEKEVAMDKEVSIYGVISKEAVALESGVRVFSDSVQGRKWVRVLLKAMKVAVRPLRRRDLTRLVVKTSEFVEWKCVRLTVSKRCDIREGKSISARRQGVVAKSLSISFMVTGENIISREMTGRWSARDTK